MQSRPTEFLKEHAFVDQPRHITSSQYGLREHGAPAREPTSSGDRMGAHDLPTANAGRAQSRDAEDSNSGELRSGGLNSGQHTRSRSPAAQIIEYEKVPSDALNRREHGPDPTPLKKTHLADKGRTALVDLPNEVLTHVFSQLPPTALAAISLVCRRFHDLVITPHAWRTAFSRYFPGSEALKQVGYDAGNEQEEILLSEKRFFTRLTALASWRSEYIIRTRLLHSLARGKPLQLPSLTTGATRSSSSQNGNAQLTYNSNLFTTVNHLDATFGTGLNKRMPRFIHGADEIGSASSSDLSIGKVDRWGFADPRTFLQFSERFPGDAQYGLGAGDIVGVPNSMDVSQLYGMVHADGSPGGAVYYRHVEEQRGRVLAGSRLLGAPELGVPRLNPADEAICSIWMAKTPNLPAISNGLIGILAGSSCGVVTSYSLGTSNVFGRRLERGEITARWVLSPGVPIIAILVDENFTSARHAQGRIFAVVLNALGEVYYLTELPQRRILLPVTRLSEEELDEIAWETGRTIFWTVLEPTRRTGTPDPFEKPEIDGSYSPRSSWDGMGLSPLQIAAETREIEQFIKKKPKDFRKLCEGWDMQRRLEVDFAGDDENGAGEAILVFGCGLNDGQVASVKRFTRLKIEDTIDHSQQRDKSRPIGTPGLRNPSLFGGPKFTTLTSSAWPFNSLPAPNSGSGQDSESQIPPEIFEVWRTSSFSFGGLKAMQITSTAMDKSIFATFTTSEDPLLSPTSSSAAPSPLASPLGRLPKAGCVSDVPGQRARLVAAGTKIGSVIIWNIRAAVSASSEFVNIIEPTRIIHTDSPQISCLAISALYLVHGGNDGLVQAWDPLASNIQPIRTLNSRFSSRARRRLMQAEASPSGVGVNLFAAGAIALDPDPMTLRGMVSLGTHLRYWSYSSSAADQYKSSKRRLRRSERGSNHVGERFNHIGRGALKDYIANEKFELEEDKENRRQEHDRLSSRFGLALQLTEEEMLAYASMLSEEAVANERARHSSVSETMTTSPASQAISSEEEVDADIAEAIRLSLQDDRSNSSSFDGGSEIDLPLRHVKRRKPLSFLSSGPGESSRETDIELDFALALSLAEERSRLELDQELDQEFPALSSRPGPSGLGNGKGIQRF